MTFEAGVHASHRLRRVSRASEAFFCTACGAYNAGGPLRLLKQACSGAVAKCRVHLHRLCALGLVPGPGVQIPSHARW